MVKPVRAKDALSIGALDHLVVNREALADAARTAIAGGIDRIPAAKCADPEALIAAERALELRPAHVQKTPRPPLPFWIIIHLKI